MRVGHAGDLGHLPTRAQAAQIGRLDLLMLPVGGYYTIDAAQAMEVRRLLQPTVTVPMHYRTQYDPEMKIAPLADFPGPQWGGGYADAAASRCEGGDG